MKLSPLLMAASARLVIVLEDVDRNGSDFDPYQIHYCPVIEQGDTVFTQCSSAYKACQGV